MWGVSNHRVAGDAKVAVSLVVGHDQDDVGPIGRPCRQGGPDAAKLQRNRDRYLQKLVHNYPRIFGVHAGKRRETGFSARTPKRR